MISSPDNPEQLMNACSPICVTLEGIIRLPVKLVQSENARAPMVVRVSGKEMLVKLVQP